MTTTFTITDIKNGKCDRPVRVIVDGVFDITHYGHYQLFQNVKKALSPQEVHLIAGVHGDDVMASVKRKPIMTLEERVKAVKFSSCIDSVIAPWPYVPAKELLESHNIDLLAHDPTPFVYEGYSDLYQWLKDADRFLEIERTEGVSTTDIIQRVRAMEAEKSTKNNGCTR